MADSQIITQWGANFIRGTWRYVRSTFAGAGQDSFTQPPSQNEDMLVQSQNLLPPLDGGFRPRWGYTHTGGTAASNLGIQSTPFFFYQNDAGNFRYAVIPQPATIPVVAENGTQITSNLFTPKRQPRMISSRSYGYFCSGNPTDLQKWNGTLGTNHLTNWGITAPVTASAGPDLAGTGSNLAGTGQAWTSPTNVSSATNYASVLVGSGSFASANSVGLYADSFGFSITQPPIGIQVTVDWTTSGGPALSGTTLYAQLVKAGSLVGTPITIFAGPSPGSGNATIVGGQNNLWGASFSAADINNAGFGVAFFFSTSQFISNTATGQVRNVNITVWEGTPIVATPGAPSSGNITLVSGRTYFAVYQNSVTGHISDLSSASNSTGPITSQDVVLTNIPVSTDPQVDTVIILATSDGGNQEQLYYVGTVTNGTTTFTDNTPDPTLVLNNVYLTTDSNGDEIGVSFNDPPPGDLQFPIKHRGRLYGVSGIKNLFFSKAESELTTTTGLIVGKFEESWPPLNFFDISEGAEEILGLLSDGQVLYIGTESRIIRLFGDGPSTYLIPEALFEDVGICNQDVWQIVFLEGNPIGGMWLTHDYRVVGSDFNTYQDIGLPVQDILNTINPAVAQQAAWATYAALGQHNLYILAIPTGSHTQPDTLLVFDLKLRQWYVWKLTDVALGAGFHVALSSNIVQNWFVTNAGQVNQFSNTTFTDAGSAFQMILQTAWTPMGDTAARKYLNEIEVLTGAANTLVTVEGASTTAEFATPNQVVLTAPLIQKPLGEYAVFLAAYPTRDRFYRMTFISTSSSFDFIRGYNIEGTVLHRI